MVLGLHHDPVANSVVFLEESLHIQLEDRAKRKTGLEVHVSTDIKNDREALGWNLPSLVYHH